MDKTLGQICCESFNNGECDAYAWGKWPKIETRWERAASAVIAHVRPQIEAEVLLNFKGRKCAATLANDPPVDCDAPYCGCDPVMAHTIESLIEGGWKPPDEIAKIEAETQSRIAELESTLDYERSQQCSCVRDGDNGSFRLLCQEHEKLVNEARAAAIENAAVACIDVPDCGGGTYTYWPCVNRIRALASAPPGHVVVSEAFKREAGLAAYFWDNGNHERFCGAVFRLLYAIEGRTPEGALPSARKPK